MSNYGSNFFIESREDLNRFISAECRLYGNRNSSNIGAWLRGFLSNPQSDQYYIWMYVKTLRKTEYHYNNCLEFKNNIKAALHTFLYYNSLRKLRRYSYKTGIQISMNSFDIGLRIYHYGDIIVNGNARIGKNATIYPGVVIGQKSGNTPRIGDNCFFGAGCKVLGGVKIGNNITIAPNAVVVKDVPDNVTVGGIPASIIKNNS